MHAEHDRQQVSELNKELLTVPQLAEDSENAIVPLLTIRKFKRALFTPTLHVFVNGHYKPTGILSVFDDKKLSLVQQLYLYIKFRYLMKPLRVEEPVLFAHDHPSEVNYYHWFCEALPRIFLMLRESRDAKVIIPEEFRKYSFVEESLQKLGADIFYLQANVSYQFSTLITVISDPPWGTVIPSLQKELRSVLLGARAVGVQATEKIFISRSKARYRTIENEMDLLPLLKKYNYQVVYTEHLSLSQQIELFSRAISVIALHGAGLTNLMFMPAGGRVLEIRDERWETNPLCYWRLANVCDIKWAVHKASTPGGQSNFNNSRIDLTRFEEDLRGFESTAPL